MRSRLGIAGALLGLSLAGAAHLASDADVAEVTVASPGTGCTTALTTGDDAAYPVTLAAATLDDGGIDLLDFTDEAPVQAAAGQRFDYKQVFGFAGHAPAFNAVAA